MKQSVFAQFYWLCFVAAAAPSIAAVPWAKIPAHDEFAAPFAARDTLDIQADPRADANSCLAGFSWTSEEFEVTVNTTPRNESPSYKAAPYLEVSFPSPRRCGIDAIDRVICEWYPARDKSTDEILTRPAVVVVHESGSGMHVGRLIAVELGRRGVHAFLIQLPGYGERKSTEFQQDDLIGVFTQGICDVRRARDAVAALPYVDQQSIGLQGTSLGGFVATLAASLDNRYDRVFLLLCGGDLHGVLTSGAKDAQKALDRLIASGVPEEEVAATLQQIEPLRIAHRLSADNTWLFSATLDDVVLPKFSKKLADTANLTSDHHQRMLATHYSGVIFLPGVLDKIRQTMLNAN